MALEQDGSGLTICYALDQRQTLATVVTVAGAHTTVDITKTSPLHALVVVIFPNFVNTGAVNG